MSLLNLVDRDLVTACEGLDAYHAISRVRSEGFHKMVESLRSYHMANPFGVVHCFLLGLSDLVAMQGLWKMPTLFEWIYAAHCTRRGGVLLDEETVTFKVFTAMPFPEMRETAYVDLMDKTRLQALARLLWAAFQEQVRAILESKPTEEDGDQEPEPSESAPDYSHMFGDLQGGTYKHRPQR